MMGVKLYFSTLICQFSAVSIDAFSLKCMRIFYFTSHTAPIPASHVGFKSSTGKLYIISLHNMRYLLMYDLYIVRFYDI